VTFAESQPQHGGGLVSAAQRLSVHPREILDASSSLAPFRPPLKARLASAFASVRHYPDTSSFLLRSLISNVHDLSPEYICIGNGAAELITWVARDAAATGLSLLFAPGFGDYLRALRLWQARFRTIPFSLGLIHPSAHAEFPALPPGDVLWLTYPHNPTGHFWTRDCVLSALDQYRLVIVDEAFLPLAPNGESLSLIPLVPDNPNLIVLRSLTKLYGIAGMRLGYAVGAPSRLINWSTWRDPWPINTPAYEMGCSLISNPKNYSSWCSKVQAWTATELHWFVQCLSRFQCLDTVPSAANFFLIFSKYDLSPLRLGLEVRHKILLRDCSSFEGLGTHWLRLGLQSRSRNVRIVNALDATLRALCY